MGIGGGGMNSAAGFDDEDNDVGLEEDINEDMPPEALWAEFKDGNEGT